MTFTITTPNEFDTWAATKSIDVEAMIRSALAIVFRGRVLADPPAALATRIAALDALIVPTVTKTA